MAIIYSYPSKGSVASGDLFVISDASDNNKTKQVTAQDIADFVDGEVTLQEVLNAGNRASSSGGGISTILLQDSTPSTTITLNGSNGQITTTGNISADGTLGVAGLSTLATVDINGGNIDGTIIGNTTIADGFFDTMRCSTADINGGTIDATVIGASAAANGTFEDITANGDINANGNLITNNSGILAVRSQGGLSLDANNGNNPTIDLNSSGGVSIISEGSGDIVISPEFAGTGDILLGNNSTGEIDLTCETLDVNADSGITIETFANNIVIDAAAGATTIDSANSTVVKSDNDVSLYAPSGAAKVRGKESAIYASAVCNSGSIVEGLPVKIVGENANGVLIVAECAADSLSDMPCIGITASTITPAGQGEIVMYGIHEFASGTVIGGGSINDPIYVGPQGGLDLSRPSGGASANEITNQIVGRVIDNINPDKILVTCTAAPSDRIIQGSIQPQLFNGGTAIPFLGAGTQGSFQVVGNEVSGIAKVTASPPVPVTLTGAFTIRLNLQGGGLLGDINNFPPNTNYPGNLAITECIMGDIAASPTVGAIAGSDIILKKPNGPHPDYTLAPNISTGVINSGDIITFSFKYWTES